MDHQQMVEMAREYARQAPFLRLASNFSPEAVIGYDKIRVGSDTDGGYVMLNDFEKNHLALSFGVDINADWDVSVANRSLKVQQYDHTVTQAPIEHDFIKFFSQKIVSLASDETGASINSLLREANITETASVILKIDIEGDEWPVFDNASIEDLNKFSQILVEFHNFSYSRDHLWLQRATRVMQKLSKLFGVYHVHANNWSAMTCIGNVYFPDTLEVSFANRSRYKFQPTNELFPTPLDRPNNPLLADLYLGAFKFASLT
jgi:Methyltransferase FkbM domain